MQNPDTLKAVVTGGAGFIGSHITEELLARGYRVVVVDDLSTGSLENINGLDGLGRLEFIQGSVTDAALLESTLQGAAFVFHQAAIPSVPLSVEHPLPTNEANVTGTLNVLNAARTAGVRKVVYASSSSVYGDTPILPKREDMPPSPLSPYAVSKLAGEYYCAAFNAVYGLPAVSLRYFNVYGPRQSAISAYAAVIPKFIEAVKAGRPPLIFGDGTQTRDFTFVKDVVQANLSAALSPAVGVYNIGCGQRVSLNQLALQVLSLLARPDLVPVHDVSRPGDVAHSLADISRAWEAFGYQPEYSLEQGLRLTAGV